MANPLSAGANKNTDGDEFGGIVGPSTTSADCDVINPVSLVTSQV